MRKSIFLLFSLLVVSSMLLAACGGGAAPAEPAMPEEPAAPAEQPAEPAAPAESGEKTVLNVWSFTNEINTMAIAFEGKNPNVDVVYTMIPMTNGEYQTKLKAALGTADVPDVIALEAAFVKEYVEADFLADLGELLPVAQEDQTYKFVTDRYERWRDQSLCLSGHPGRRILSP
jgi:ABC-type glycerol-3-phosphate transport system substrate-binding protein